MSGEQSAESIASLQRARQEAQRRWILQQMGITPLQSRPAFRRESQKPRVLVPAEWLPDTVGGSAIPPAQSSAAQAARQHPRTAGGAHVRRVSATLAEPTPSQPSGEAKRPATPRSAPPTPTPAEFSVVLAACGGWLWLEYLPDRLLHNDQLALIANIGRVMNPDHAQCIHRQFDWPIAQQSALAPDLATGLETLGGMLGRLQREQQTQGLFVLGEESVPYCPPGQPIVATLPSTAAMMRQAQLKAVAWQVLRPLARSSKV